MFYKTNVCTSDFRRLYVVPSLIAYNECSAQPMNTEEELWETAESTGQRHVHSGNDPGTKRWWWWWGGCIVDQLISNWFRPTRGAGVGSISSLSYSASSLSSKHQSYVHWYNSQVEIVTPGIWKHNGKDPMVRGSIIRVKSANHLAMTGIRLLRAVLLYKGHH